MINKLEDGYKMVRQAVVEFFFHLAEALAFKCDEMLINALYTSPSSPISKIALFVFSTPRRSRSEVQVLQDKIVRMLEVAFPPINEPKKIQT